MQKYEKVTLNALLKEDLEPYIEALGIKEDFEKGVIKCYKCEVPLTYDNIGAIYYKDKKPNFVCDKPLCYQSVPIER